MKTMILYLRTHPGQRLALTVSFTAMLAAALAVLLNPVIGDYILIHRLTSSNPKMRTASAERLALRAISSPRALARLETRLATKNDDKFVAAARVLNMIGQFDIPSRPPEMIDRWRAIQLTHTTDPNSRYAIVWTQCLADRDNAYVRQLLATAAADQFEEIRSLAAIIAAKLPDDATLAKLLADQSANVRGAAAIDAAIARRKDLLQTIAAEHLEPDNYSADCMLYALALTGADLAAPLVADRIADLVCDADDDRAAASLDRALLTAELLDDETVTDAILGLFETCSQEGRHPPALAMIVAAQRGMADIAPHVRSVLRTAADPHKSADVTVGQLMAALQATELLNTPARREVYDVVYSLWAPQREDIMVVAARVLGLQADMPQESPDVPTRNECIKLLQNACTWMLREQLPDGSDRLQFMPLASASAAAALWNLHAQDAEHFVRDAAASQFPLPGDYIAWRIAHTDPAGGMQLGMNMLPALDAPQELRVYNDDERSAGAMLLALSAATDEQRKAAAQRIRSRLIGGEYGGEDVRRVRWTYMCALTILRDDTYRNQLSALLSLKEFPRRRLLTALLAVRDAEAMDWLLWHVQFSDAAVADLLLDREMGDLLADVAPDLPRIDWAGRTETRLWQAMILRNTYAIRRRNLILREIP